MKTPPPVAIRVKRRNSRQVRGQLCRGAANGPETRETSWRKLPMGQTNLYYTKKSIPPMVIQQQEMGLFFKLFDDDLIRDFLRNDSCYKLTDKYLLAMTFIYFKRARFSVSEYTRKNFFIALYLAHTMEEDEEKTKYEIFPWALGKTWRKQFPHFLKQRDKLWARIEYRAAVNKRCCEEVMSIVSSHFVWQRQRSVHHSGAQREYYDQDFASLPLGPFASPTSCDQCKPSSNGLLSTTEPSNKNHPLVFSSALSLEATPPRATGSKWNTQETHSCSFCSEEFLRKDLACNSTHDLFMDWFEE